MGTGSTAMRRSTQPDPLAVTGFVSFEGALDLSDKMRARVLKDCQQSFSARSGGGSKYSEGSTFWMPRDEAPRCLLEQLAQSTFDYYSQGLEFDARESGAEWWTMVIDTSDDIGFHWDKDYFSEAEEGLNVCPSVAT